MAKPLSDAVQVVAVRGQREKLRSRLIAEHPVDRRHQSQYDQRLIDVFTEACAFAWADLRQFGTPRFDFSKGMPDIYVDPNGWVEAKAIHTSDSDRTAWAKAMESGEIRVGRGVVTSVNPLPEGLHGKLEATWTDAMRKFLRCPPGRFVLYVNITDFDFEQWMTEDETLDRCSAWADSKHNADGQIDIVLSFNYSWSNPFRDPLKIAGR